MLRRLLRTGKICIKEFPLLSLNKFSIITSNKYIEEFVSKKRLGPVVSDNKQSKDNNKNKKRIMEVGEEKITQEELLNFGNDLSPSETMNNKKKEKNITVNDNSMKLNKKLAQGVKVLTSSEKRKFEEIVQEKPSKNLIVIHFGNGKAKL